jgi:hypothetical protein
MYWKHLFPIAVKNLNNISALQLAFTKLSQYMRSPEI